MTPWVGENFVFFYLSERFVVEVFLLFTTGMAFLHGMCDPKKRCSVSQDNGLNVAFTVAHEIGHK